MWTNVCFHRYFPNSKYFGSLLWESLIGVWTLWLFVWAVFVQRPVFSDAVDARAAWTWILLTGACLTATNAAFYTALNLTSPVFVNFGAFFTVPLAFVLDVFVHSYAVSALPIAGALLIMLGFVMLEIVPEPRCFAEGVAAMKRRWRLIVRIVRIGRRHEAEHAEFIKDAQDVQMAEAIKMDDNPTAL